MESASALPAVASAPSAATALPAPSGAVAPSEMDGLVGRLVREAHDRPTVSPTADEVLAAVEKQGESIPTKQQSLGETYNASYCLGGYTVDGAFAISACEYPDAAKAEAGRALSKSILAKVTTRDVWAHKATTLAIVQLKLDDVTTTAKKKLVAAFMAM